MNQEPIFSSEGKRVWGVGLTGELVFDSEKPDGTPRKFVDVGKRKAMWWDRARELEGSKSEAHMLFHSSLERQEAGIVRVWANQETTIGSNQL